MFAETVAVVGGVDTHADVHVAAAVDSIGRQLGTAEFLTTPRGHRDLLLWLRSHGDLETVGVEGTGAWGAGLARFLASAGVSVVEVDRPNRQHRRRHGKSDPADAQAAARAALSGDATGVPKSRDGTIESIRALRVARRSALKARTQAGNQLYALVVTAPDDLRNQLRGLSTRDVANRAARFRPNKPTTPTGSTTKPHSPLSEGPAPSTPPPDVNNATASTAAATETPTTHSGGSPWSECAPVNAPTLTSPNAPTKD